MRTGYTAWRNWRNWITRLVRRGEYLTAFKINSMIFTSTAIPYKSNISRRFASWYVDKELKKDRAVDKTGILDVKVRLKDKTVINIEIQNIWDESFINRTLFYWAKIYIEEFRQGDDYSQLHRCITINIVGKGFELNDKIHSKYILKEESTDEKLTDIMEMHFLNLESARKVNNNEDILVRWLLFIDTDSKEERHMLARNSPVLKLLNEKIDLLSLTPKERKLYESRMMLKSDIVSI